MLPLLTSQTYHWKSDQVLMLLLWELASGSMFPAKGEGKLVGKLGRNTGSLMYPKIHTRFRRTDPSALGAGDGVRGEQILSLPLPPLSPSWMEVEEIELEHLDFFSFHLSVRLFSKRGNMD